MLDNDSRILIVDDFSAMRGVVRKYLRSLGYKNTTEAEDGVRALQILKTSKIDLLITDWNMPRLSGIELLRFIRADSDLKTIPVLFVTAEGEKEKIVSAIDAGATNYILKPFSEEILREKLESMFPD